MVYWPTLNYTFVCFFFVFFYSSSMFKFNCVPRAMNTKRLYELFQIFWVVWIYLDILVDTGLCFVVVSRSKLDWCVRLPTLVAKHKELNMRPLHYSKHLYIILPCKKTCARQKAKVCERHSRAIHATLSCEAKARVFQKLLLAKQWSLKNVSILCDRFTATYYDIGFSNAVYKCAHMYVFVFL